MRGAHNQVAFPCQTLPQLAIAVSIGSAVRATGGECEDIAWFMGGLWIEPSPMPLVRGVLLLVCLALAGVRARSDPPTGPWLSGPGFRRLPVRPAARDPGFTRLPAAELGILWTNTCPATRYARRQNLMNGAGVALGDFDGDGWCDIYLCNRGGPSALYRNLGNWHFTNVTEQAGVAAADLFASGALFADFNGDGCLDLHVTSFLGPDALFLNRGDGTFTNIIQDSGVSTAGGATSSAAADLDGDGDLDLYVARFAMEALLRDGTAIVTRMVAGRPVVAGRAGRRITILNNKLYENGDPDLIGLNKDGVHFEAISWQDRFVDETGRALTGPPRDLGFAVQLRDINGDGSPDIYVCNDFQTPDQCWVNDGTGHFHALPGVALRNMSYASMGVDFADIDRDGSLDFFTIEMLPVDHFHQMTHFFRGIDPDLHHPRDPLARDAFARSVLNWNRGDGTYAEIAWFAGVATSDWSWTPIFLDVDLDGYEDLLSCGGYPHDVNDLDFAGRGGRGEGRAINTEFTTRLEQFPTLDAPHLAWRNRGNLTFEDRSARWHFDDRLVTHGMALADLDNDGDLDVVGNVFNQPPLIHRNDGSAPRIAVRLEGRQPNTHGIGARIRLLGGPVPQQQQEMLAGGRYLSCDQTQRTFAAGTSNAPLTLEIRWRSGELTAIPNAVPDSIYIVDEPIPASITHASPSVAEEAPLFTRIPVPAEFQHHDAPFDESARQSLLPWHLAFQGPGVAWSDWDGDGQDECLVGNGRGFRLASGRVARRSPDIVPVHAGLDGILPDDGLGLLSADLGHGHKSVFVSVARYEDDTRPTATVERFDSTDSVFHSAASLPFGRGSPGPLAAADLDDDGDLDLVVGGRLLPGRYPEPADTLVYTNHLGTLSPDSTASAPLRQAGLVTGVLFVDLDGDGRQECVLASEWGPLRVFAWHRGQPVERTSALGLAAIRGVWQGLAAADFDGDGRLDLVAANWGRNSHQQRAPAGPWRLTYGDFDGDGRLSIIECYLDPLCANFVPTRTQDVLATELPWLNAAFPTHAAFGRASVAQLLGERVSLCASVEATTLASVVLLNRGSHFEVVELPREAQWTPLFGFAAADFDGDGDIDLFCPQNFFDVRDEDDRMDAGLGLLLLNDGTGRFHSATAARSGIRILGQQRGAAVTDLDGDGRADLAVTQNGGSLVLLHNTRAAPGLTLRLTGSASNPEAIGAQARLIGGHWQGPLYEVRAGSGRYSQDSAALVLGGRERADRIWIRFPGRPPGVVRLPDGAHSATVALVDGTMRVINDPLHP